MKKLIAFLTLAGMLTFGVSNLVVAQEQGAEDQGEQMEMQDTTQMEPDTVAVAETPQETTLEPESEEPQSFQQVLKEQFIAGDWKFMGIVLLTLVFGLALAIERIIYLNLATTNNKKLLNKVENALETGGIDAAKDICRDTRGPVASIFFQGLDRFDEGIEVVEKSIVSYGSVLMGRLEKGLSWISLFIAIAPMLGFMGTVIGMIMAFDDIAAAGDISPTIVASGMKVALLTTVFGLIVAIILQIFYNYLVAKVDNLVNDMEDSTISFIDILTKFKSNK
ncbi:MAG: MotA/TolQ/ExbB proton channel family protein [Bacteroidales bacterium]|nr:MotA/TolQ/ExbB proton channel family protein [Bacteroidales bacterium]MCF8344807.1 MotA/TolQ/ExbB proton channel family protein [Bacteroidales bacterium]MCF8352570.1 MotA/TolQ/ExbB proton channel family protein [Bacteroidales bacterium]MCF8377626.1 MotA/TolQ/ExbB proton channel family protein [Bacteroidales bacterium]MCF8402030.1 MotA/TolQ/ExbB proton channel family protein [Bacteroidales bacterium]